MVVLWQVYTNNRYGLKGSARRNYDSTINIYDAINLHTIINTGGSARVGTTIPLISAVKQ